MPTRKAEQKDEDSRAYQKRMPALARRMEGVRLRASGRLRSGWEDILNDVGYTGASGAPLDLPVSGPMRKRLRRYATPSAAAALVARHMRRGSYTARTAIRDLGRVEAAIAAEEVRVSSMPIIERTVEEAHERTQFGIRKEIALKDDYEPPSGEYVQRIADKGLPYSTAHIYTYRGMTEPLHEVLMQGIRAGKSPDVIGRDLAKASEDMRPYRARALARTVITESASITEAETLKAAGLEEYQYIATLDERTCEVCGHMDGRVFRLEDRESGVNSPPMHINCRCTIACVIPAKYRSGNEQRSARNEKGGWGTVPASMTYDEWKAQNEDRLNAMRKKSRNPAKRTGKGASAPTPDPYSIEAEAERVRKLPDLMKERDDQALKKADEEADARMAELKAIKEPTEEDKAEFKAWEEVIAHHNEPGYVGESPEYTSVLQRFDGVMSSVKSKWDSEHIPDIMRKDLSSQNVTYLAMKPNKKELNGPEIIAKLGGLDRTKGSCVSQAFAYVLNKNGLDVTDFRGGESEEYFASKGWKNLLDEGKARSGQWGIRETKKALNDMEVGKEYMLVAGRHCSIVRMGEEGPEYLELQNIPKYNRWWKMEGGPYGNLSETLRERFKVKGKSWSGLADISEFEGNEEILKLGGYINTEPDKAVRGEGGAVK